jgi:long-chain acyl-CoA synthetase
MHLDTLPEILDHWADTRGDKIWLRDLKEDGSEDYSWSEARRQVKAAGGSPRGSLRHAVTAWSLLSRNRPHWFLADLAIISSGNVTVSMFTTLPAATAQYIADFH